MQEHLLKICIDRPKKDSYGYEDAHAPEEYPDVAQEEADAHHRRLLAGAAVNPCAEGKVRFPFYPT